VAPSVTLAHLKWLERLAVPISSLSNPRFPHAISWNREDLAASAVRQLAARGCRRIGLITTLLAHKDPDADSYQLGLWRGFTGALERAGLEIHPGRMAGSKDLNHIPSQSEMPACGFAGFNRLWNGVAAGERPDGLFIYPDTAAIGAVMALGMHNIQVPRDLRLVLHTNAEFPVFCPYPADRLVVRVADAAHALIGHIRDQLANRAPASRLLPNHLEPDDGSPLHS
jgi:DNA-binding LacI/PurR family transcriptional regulator